MTMQDLFLQFNGRISRKIFIFASLFLFFLQSALTFVALNMMGISIGDFQDLEDYQKRILPEMIPINLLFSLLFLWPSLALGVKRLQDIGWSGRFYVMLCVSLVVLYFIAVMGMSGSGSGGAGDLNLGLISVINLLVLGTYIFLVIMVFWPGSDGRNQYGDASF